MFVFFASSFMFCPEIFRAWAFTDFGAIDKIGGMQEITEKKNEMEEKHSV